VFGTYKSVDLIETVFEGMRIGQHEISLEELNDKPYKRWQDIAIYGILLLLI
jgi:hypothetical protein